MIVSGQLTMAAMLRARATQPLIRAEAKFPRRSSARACEEKGSLCNHNSLIVCRKAYTGCQPQCWQSEHKRYHATKNAGPNHPPGKGIEMITHWMGLSCDKYWLLLLLLLDNNHRSGEEYYNYEYIWMAMHVL